MNELVNQRSLNELALFAGAGGGILGGKLLGWRTVAAVEWEPYPAAILAQRQNEKVLEAFPIWDDVQTFDGKPWRGIVDVVSGGFPCQDISSAGKGAGLDGAKSSMWFNMLRIINEVQPEYCFIENSPHLRTKGLVTVLQGLAEAGYDAAWCVLSAEDLGANHERKRMWILGRKAAKSNLHSKSVCTIDAEAQRVQRATGVCKEATYTSNERIERREWCKENAEGETTYTNLSQQQGGCISSGGQSKDTNPGLGTWWKTPPSVYRMDDGVAFGMDRLKAIGNGQVPIVAASAFTHLKSVLESNLN